MFDRTELCLYHQDKPGFNLIQKDLQKWIPQKYIHRLAMAICCCRRDVRDKKFHMDSNRLSARKTYLHDLLNKDTSVHNKCSDNLKQYILNCLDQVSWTNHSCYQKFHMDSNRLSAIKTYLHDILNKDTSVHKCSDHLKQYILNCLEQVNETDYSCCRFLDILYQARHGDFTSLYRERKNSDSIKDEKSGSGKGDNDKKKKMTKTQIECMLRKRKRRMEMNVVKLLMFPGNFPKLQSECNLTELTKQNNCFVETHDKWNNQSFTDNKNVTYVKIWTNKGEMLEKLRRSLTHKAAEIQQNLDDLRRRRKQERKSYNASWRAYEPWNRVDNALDAHKETMSEDYDLKCKKSKSKTAKVPTPSVLDKGHCLHCHKEFSTLKDKTLCKHHSGFIVKETWNCCGESISSTRIMKTPGYNDHLATGCVEAPTHVWRVHNRSDHKQRKVGAGKVNREIECC